jgi:hypothetical protein
MVVHVPAWSEICMLQLNNSYGCGVFLSFQKLKKSIIKLYVVLSTFVTMEKVIVNAAVCWFYYFHDSGESSCKWCWYYLACQLSNPV